MNSSRVPASQRGFIQYIILGVVLVLAAISIAVIQHLNPVPSSNEFTASLVGTGGATIVLPIANSSLPSPVHVTANDNTNAGSVKLMQIYIDGAKAYEIKGYTIDTYLTLALGTHTLTVQALKANYSVLGKATESITVVMPTPTPTPTPTPAAPTPTPTSTACLASSATWQSNPFSAQTGSFSTTFDVTPNMAATDGLTGLSRGVPASYTDLAAIVRFNTTGLIDARDGSGYTPSTISYTVGLTYHVRLLVNVVTHTYSAYVTPPGSAELTLGTNLAFRTEQASVTSLTYWSLWDDAGTHTVCNFALTALVTPTPTPTSTPTPTPTPTSTPTPLPTPTPTPTPPTPSPSGCTATVSSLSALNSAAASASPGAVICVSPGTYNGSITTSRSGTASAPITFISTTKWGAKIVSGGTPAWLNSGDYSNIKGFDIKSAGPNGIKNIGSYDRVESNYVHDIPNSGCASGAGILEGGYTSLVPIPSHNTFANNVIKNIGSGSLGSCNQQHGLYLTLPYGTAYNNIVYNSVGRGIQMWHYATHDIVVNNTIFNSGWGMVIGCDLAVGINDYTFVGNNIAVNDVNYGIYTDSGCYGSHNITTNNLSYGNGTNWGSGFIHVNDVTADPKFVNYQPAGSGDYHLQSTSPAIDKGTSTNAPSPDFDGYPRPYGVADDIGAYEWH